MRAVLCVRWDSYENSYFLLALFSFTRLPRACVLTLLAGCIVSAMGGEPESFYGNCSPRRVSVTFAGVSPVALGHRDPRRKGCCRRLGRSTCSVETELEIVWIVSDEY